MFLTDSDQALLSGSAGPGTQLAMQVVVDLGEAMGAEHLIDISSAHVDGCFYVGNSSIDFVTALVDGGAQVRVPTTSNVGSVDLLHGQLQPLVGDGEDAARLMSLYERLGCANTWTCAPYEHAQNPAPGSDVAWGESNAIIYANSVLGARTERYGDFVDVSAAIVGRVPHAGLHRPENRRATLEFSSQALTDVWREAEELHALLGHIIGRRSGGHIPVVTGLPKATPDQLKALGAAAASSGSCALFHFVGSTPEAPTRSAVVDGEIPIIDVSDDDLVGAWIELNSGAKDYLEVVCLGTPHFSVTEFRDLSDALQDRRVNDTVRLVVSTSRATLAQAKTTGIQQRLERQGVEFVVDTCTYNSRVLGAVQGLVMTNSAKWAWYGPMNIGVNVAFAGLRTCVEAAVSGKAPTVVHP